MRDKRSRRICLDCGAKLPPRKRVRCSICAAEQDRKRDREWKRTFGKSSTLTG